MAKNTGMPFPEWLKSKHNPFHDASEQVRHFSKDALQAAFEAGEMRARKQALDARKARRIDNFSFETTLEWPKP